MNWRRLIIVIVVFGASAGAVAALRDRVKINWYTDSMPRGIYLIEHRQPGRGDIAASCLTPDIVDFARKRDYIPPFHGRGCSHQLYPLAKYVYAVPGDTVAVHDNEVAVNGQETGIHRLVKDSQGRDMPEPPEKQTLQSGQYWLMSDYQPGSFDSRYFGPVPVLYVLKPLWISDHDE